MRHITHIVPERCAKRLVQRCHQPEYPHAAALANHMGNVGSGSDEEQPPGWNDRDERPTLPKRPIRRGQVGQERRGSAAEAASCSSSDGTGNSSACWGDPPSAALGAPGPRVARLPLQYLHEQPSELIHRDLCVSISYHAYFTHKSFETYPLIQWILMILTTGTLQGSIDNWCSGHRMHHRYAS